MTLNFTPQYFLFHRSNLCEFRNPVKIESRDFGLIPKVNGPDNRRLESTTPNGQPLHSTVHPQQFSGNRTSGLFRFYLLFQE